VRKDLLAVGVAVVAGAGAVAAVVVSSHDGSGAANAVSSSGQNTPASSSNGTLPTNTTTGSSVPGATSTSGGVPVVPPTTTTSPVPATTAKLPPPPAPHGPRLHAFTVGVVDDSLAQQDSAAADSGIRLSRRAGFGALALTTTWKPGLTAPRPGSLRGIRNVAEAAKRAHMRLFIVVWNGLGRNTPRSGAEREQFAQFTAAVARAVPSTYAVIVGNEPNLSTFWKPQFGAGGSDAAARAYEDLLARSYDALKEAAPHVRVVGVGLSPRGADRPNGIRPTHSPTAFIRDLGAAYRASGRKAPLMDAFAIHPYMLTSKVPPTVSHPKTTQITLADYPKLVTLLDEAFRGTPQRGRTLPILYTEFGVQTTIPQDKLAAYQTAKATEALRVSPELQAAYYRKALALAYCQPTVKGLFIFHTFDEFSLDGWQSGLYYADHTAKASLPLFRRAVEDLRHGKLTACRPG
jgi:hypothetical protein